MTTTTPAPTTAAEPVEHPHGTPERHLVDCKGKDTCPALYEHGMSCTIAYVRSTTTPDRYFKAKARDPRPAAIARTLGLHPEPRPDTIHLTSSPAPLTVDADTPSTLPEPTEPPAPTAPPADLPAESEGPEPTAREIRAWAKNNGYTISDKARIPTDIRAAFKSRPGPHDSCFTEHARLTGERDRARNLAARLEEELAATTPTATQDRPEWGYVQLQQDLETVTGERDSARNLAGRLEEELVRTTTTLDEQREKSQNALADLMRDLGDTAADRDALRDQRVDLEAHLRYADATIKGLENDERIHAWETIAKHPLFRDCYDAEEPLLPAIITHLDALVRAKPEFCDQCNGPYGGWLEEQYAGHWDTCPNRPKQAKRAGEVLPGENVREDRIAVALEALAEQHRIANLIALRGITPAASEEGLYGVRLPTLRPEIREALGIR